MIVVRHTWKIYYAFSVQFSTFVIYVHTYAVTFVTTFDWESNTITDFPFKGGVYILLWTEYIAKGFRTDSGVFKLGG